MARRSGGRTHGAFAGHVVVGVDGTPASRAALEFAFEEATLHRRPLVAVFVTDRRTDDFWYDETILSTHFAAEPAALELLATEVEPWFSLFKLPDGTSVTLVRSQENRPWVVPSTLKYTVSPPHYIDLKVHWYSPSARAVRETRECDLSLLAILTTS